MTDDIINQAIEEAAVEAPAEAVVETPIEENVVESTEVEETPEATEEITEEAPATEDTPFPKKAVNAIARRDKKYSKLQANYAAAQSELQQFREQAEKTEVSSVPKEEDYDNYGEFLKAVTRQEMKQEASEESLKQQETQVAEKEQAYVAERETYAIDKANAAIAEIPEYQQLVTEHADVLQSLPPHLERAFLEAEEPAYAFLALAKEGALESLSELSPARAAMEIGKAEVRGAAMAKQKQITKAPAPIASLKGGGKTSKSLDTMNSDQLLAWVNS